MERKANRSEEREMIGARVSAASAEGWRAFCAQNGVSLSAFIEIAGVRLADEPYPPQTPERIAMIEEARQVDQERRSRQR